MLHRFLVWALGVAVAAPALAVGYDKLDLFREIGLAEGQWATVLTIEKMALTPDLAMADDPGMAEKIKGAQAQEGRTFNTTDCLGDRLSPKGELVLPGLTIAGECTISDSSVTGDDFALTAVCGEKSDVTLTFKGSKTGTSMNGTADMQVVGGGMTMAITTRVESKWAGACPAR